jgi:hypothetical protein
MGAMSRLRNCGAIRVGSTVHERHPDHLREHVAGVTVHTVLAEGLAVVGGEDQDRPVELTLGGQLLPHPLDRVVDPADRSELGSAGVRAEALELGRRRVLVHVHRGLHLPRKPPHRGCGSCDSVDATTGSRLGRHRAHRIGLGEPLPAETGKGQPRALSAPICDRFRNQLLSGRDESLKRQAVQP